MITFETILLMSLIVLVAYLTKATTGFGTGLIMMPFFLLFLDIKFILPVLLTVTLIADFYLLYHFKKHVHKGIISFILIASIIGVIFGTYLLNILDSKLIKVLFAVFIILFSIRMLFFEKTKKTEKKVKKILGLIAGFFGGFIDAIFGTGGPPIVMYLSHMGVKKAIFRATCVMTFFIFHISRLITYSYSGLMSFEVIKISFYLVPAMIIGSMIGMKIHVKLNEILFKRVVAVILFCIGIVLLI